MERRRAPERLTTARMRAERLAEQHAEGLHRIYGDPRVGETMGGVKSPATIRESIARADAHWEEHGFGLWAFFVGDELVARGGLMPTVVHDEPTVEVAWGVLPAYWGQGLATELAEASVRVAWDDLGLPEVVAYTLPTNLASRRVMEKLGMTYAGDVEHAGMPHVLYRLRSE
jgi:ribosomal-protein-alanine N-acetyltransferase